MHIRKKNRCLFRDPYKTHKMWGQNAEFVEVKAGGTYNNPLGTKLLDP